MMARLPIEQLREAYLRAILAGELPMAERIIREAIDSGLGEAAIDTEIITPAMAAVGDQWASGSIGIADEHLATDISMRMITLQREAFRVARKRSLATVLLAAVEGERHILGLEMAASALLHAGFDVRMLGADVPSAALAATVERTGARVLGLTASTPAAAFQAQRAISLARQRSPSLGVVIGGAAADHARHLGPATARCTHVGEAVDVVEALSQRALLN